MRFSISNHAGRRQESGQVMLLFILLIIVLVLFIGLGVDLGFSYITKAQLSKAVDAAALSAIRNLSQGTNTAMAVAQNTFDLNYGTSGRDVDDPHVVIQIFNDANNNETVDITATVSINTFFIRVLPQWSTLTVASSAEAVRDNVNMTLVLDTSGSMIPTRGPPPGGDGTGSGGGEFLPGAVTTFINNFDEVHDKAAVVSFASIQTNIFYGDLPPQPIQPFKAPIISDVDAFSWTGSTFSQGGLTNALVLENNATIPSGQSVVKIVVFCTDGRANIVQDTLECPTPTLLNFGGKDSPNSDYDLFDPVTGDQLPLSACGAAQFHSAIKGGALQDLDRANISLDAAFRAVQVANQMRANGIVVYAIGVGSGFDATFSTFLAQVANDPSLAGTPDYAATSFDGEFVIANDPSTLSTVFQTIASKILLRLSK